MINTLPKSLIEAAEKHLTHIDVDGELKHKFNSEGKLIHHTEDGIRNFHRWFGNSQSVDKEGKPLVVYHGTANKFDEFSKDKIGSTYGVDDHGFYFTSSSDQADKWADSAEAVGIRNKTSKYGDGRVVKAYINMKNPWTIHADTSKETGMSPVAHFESGNGQFNRGQQNTVQYAVDSEYDGLVVRDHKHIDDAHEAMFVAFHPHQIKSATHNNGDFSNKPTIHESTTDRPFTQDEYGKNIVFDNDEYKISVNDPHDASYIALWHAGKAVGKMYLGHGRTSNTKGYSTIRSVDIDKKHQGQGMGKQMYKTAMTYIHDKYKGIGSEQPDRVNKKQVPAIFRRMGGKFHESGDITIDKHSQLSESASGMFSGITGDDIHWMNTSDVVKMSAPIPTYINDQEYSRLWDDLNTHGMKTPLEITVSNSHARLDSGNHRIQLFNKHGIKKVPVTIKETKHVIDTIGNGDHIGITIDKFNEIDPR